ncbi:MAG: DUF2892 domain-containing protein [Balneolaceae bacterium]|nr:DUF2892 domain-containing protein [Balneolaceae bacterium]
MKKNMGTTDRVIRIVIALIFAALYFSNVINDTVAMILSFIALIFIFTSAVSFCPLYKIFGIQTCKVERA